MGRVKSDAREKNTRAKREVFIQVCRPEAGHLYWTSDNFRYVEVSRISATSLPSCALLPRIQRRPSYLRPNFLVRLQCSCTYVQSAELIDSE